MRKWVVKSDGCIVIKFQPDNLEESKALDKLLSFDKSQSRAPIYDVCDLKAEGGAREVAFLSGHESERTIYVPLTRIG